MKIQAAVGLVVVFAIASCGGSSERPTVKSTPATAAPATRVVARLAPMTQQQAAQRYLAAVKPLNAATDTWNAVVRTSPTPATAAPAADKLAQALAEADMKLLRLARDYHPSASGIQALVNADAQVEGTLRSLVAQTADALPSWTQQMATTNATAATAAQAVRGDLGLPLARIAF